MNRSFLAAAAFLSVCTTAAFADTCPPDKVLTTPRTLEQIPAQKLSREVLANVRLEGWHKMGGFIMRMRRLELQPGGFVYTHDHTDRPAIVYIMKGTVVEHNSLCAVPIVHHAGESEMEFGPGFMHWWENTGDEVVVFVSTDILRYDSPDAPFVGFEE